MKRNPNRLYVIVGMLLSVGIASAADPNVSIVEPNESRTWVVLMSGINRDPDENQAKSRAMMGMVRFWSQRVPAERLWVLADKESFVMTESCVDSTVENCKIKLTALARQVQPEDRVFFYFTGQANIVKKTLRLNLDGPDLCHPELVALLSALPCRRAVVVLDCPGGGLAVKPLARPGWVVITAAGSDQSYTPRFSNYFVPALTGPPNDDDTDTRVSLLDAFTETSKQLDSFYQDRDLAKTENPLLEDDGDGRPSQQPWTYEQSGKDGALAAQIFLDTW